MYQVFQMLFVGGTVAFLLIEGLVLLWQHRRIRRLEDRTWKVRYRHDG